MQTPTTLLTSLCALLMLGGGLFLSGCTTKKKVMHIEVTDGCTLSITGLSVEQAKEITSGWKFDENCKLNATEKQK